MTDNDAPCSECGGSGSVTAEYREPITGIAHDYKVNCPTCGGSGKSPAGRKEILQMTDEPSKANVKITVS